MTMHPVPPPAGSTDFSLDLWDETRSFVTEPRWSGPLSEEPELRREFLAGAALMGYRLEPYDPDRRLREITDPVFKQQERARRTEAGYLEQLLPQQLLIADALNAGVPQSVIEVARRASKTTSIFLWLLGRVASRPGYQATFSAQSGVAGSRRLREWAAVLDRQNPPDDLDLPPWMRGQRRVSKHDQRMQALFDLEPAEAPATSGRGFKIMRGEVGKGLYFDHGSQLLVLKPDANAYRGEAADVSWIDEAQEIDPLEGDELLAGILPLQDTKPGSMVVISGTAGEARVGPFWTFVDALRRGSDEMGGLDWAFDPATPWEAIDDREQALALLDATHPGIGTLTTTETMGKRYDGLTRPQWAREYGSVWPETAGEVVVDAEQWENAQLDRWPSRPTRMAFGFDIKPGGSVGSIAAAWRDAAGVAHIEVVAHRLGTKWLPEELQRVTMKYRATAAYDAIAEAAATATESERLSPRPRLKPQTFRETAAGCVQLLRDLDRGNLRHSGQLMLDQAVQQAARRDVRGDAGVWLLTPATHSADITPLVAAVRALRNWDQHYARTSLEDATEIRIAVA